MSQQSNAIAGSSQQHSDNSSLHYHRCWWAWCRCSFYAKRELLDHITLHHVQQVQPERLRDISARKIAESDSWDSLDFSSLPPLPSSSHSQSEVSSQEGTQCERMFSLTYQFRDELTTQFRQISGLHSFITPITTRFHTSRRSGYPHSYTRDNGPSNQPQHATGSPSAAKAVRIVKWPSHSPFKTRFFRRSHFYTYIFLFTFTAKFAQWLCL